MTNPDDESPLHWDLRVSPRARQAKLQIKPYGGLEVVIPPRFPRAQIPSLVERHAAWARRQVDRQARLRDAVRLPEQIRLAYDDSITPVVYAGEPLTSTGDLFAELSPARLVVEGRDQSARIGELRDWIRRRARALLPPKLHEVSRRTGLEFARVSIRSQKTRWGSCSIRGHISLNDQLLFLPANTVEYLMIHELCHTRELNHSRRFWRLVQSHCPDYRRHEAVMNRSRDSVPDWFLLDLYR
ncbi:MAG: SprT family zinc-dependent metalloprotease [Gammaproteobacteria bacterium]|jgi:predicted metal-dependent hydrolase